MKKILIIIGVIIIAVLGYFGYNYIQNQPKQEETSQTDIPGNTTQSETPSDTTTQSDVTVTLPQDWQKVEGSSLEHQYMKGTASFMLKNEEFGTTDLDEVVTKALSIFKTAFEDVKQIGETKDIKVDGRDAKEFVFTAKIGGADIEYMYVYTEVNNKIYAITFADLANTFDNNTGDYQTILDGIRF